MTTHPYAALIFDCDGVLVDSETIHVAVEIALLTEMGLAYEWDIYLSRFVGLGVPEFHAALAEDYAALGYGPFPDDFGPRLHARAWPRIEAELTALPGAAALAAKFSGPIAVASSSITPKLRRKLELTGLTETFAPHIYSADQVARGKPSPDLFLFAADNIKSAPATCLVIEDSVNGVKAARAAGMTAFGFTGGGHADAGLCERLIAAGAVASFDSHDAIAAHLFPS
ncbi:HAD family hydrolase [Hyphomonas oceanitis]|uniref:HAD superfamily hydrolase n=1 Tax=Hyphomonas oceanitis SCH89 TaxID=1280953 RepID=A0A059G5T4_9PROT|nr:HAD-IA family hydrolase [Hyphomonas oceanitis]KDA02094.1 HAD superfamily hydrolase [Hyphomonas oceanitis SCH89]